MKHLSLVPLIFTLPLSMSVFGQTILYEEDFSAPASVDAWTLVPVWSGTEGTPSADGAALVSNNVQPSNINFTVDIPLDLTENSDLVVSFDAKALVNVAGVFHFYAEPENNPQFFIKFNNEADINGSTFTKLTFNVDDVPASSSFITLRFEMITGAVLEADVVVAIDNVLVTGPAIPVEGEWEGYQMDDNGWVDTVDHLGFINVTFAPWYFSLDLNRFFFVGDATTIGSSATAGAWMYMTK